MGVSSWGFEIWRKGRGEGWLVGGFLPKKKVVRLGLGLIGGGGCIYHAAEEIPGLLGLGRFSFTVCVCVFLSPYSFPKISVCYHTLPKKFTFHLSIHPIYLLFTVLSWTVAGGREGERGEREKMFG